MSLYSIAVVENDIASRAVDKSSFLNERTNAWNGPSGK
jgi:hypothetical protein